jgi:hypothetical protein
MKSYFKPENVRGRNDYDLHNDNMMKKIMEDLHSDNENDSVNEAGSGSLAQISQASLENIGREKIKFFFEKV